MNRPPVQIESTSIHCIGCGYDLSGTPIGGRCPECGMDVALTLRSSDATTPTMPLATASMIIGVVSIAACAPLGIVAVILGVRALADLKSGRHSASSRSMANAGIILGIIGCALTALFALFFFGMRELPRV